jgi:hypothetical protein
VLRTAMRMAWELTPYTWGLSGGFFKIHKPGSQKPKNGCLIYI